VTPAKSGDQDVEVSDVFVEFTEKTHFPVFGFSGGWNLALGRGKRRLPEKKLRSEEQDLEVCDMLRPIREPKWNPG
jgi:hypothetical protein